MKAKLIIILVCLAEVALGQTQSILASRSDSIEFVKTKLRESGQVTSYSTGIKAKVSLQYQRFIYLVGTLSDSELLELVSDSSACVRIYGYAGITHRKHAATGKIGEILKKDRTKVRFMFGCVAGTNTVASVAAQIDQFYNRPFLDCLLKKEDARQRVWQSKIFP